MNQIISPKGFLRVNDGTLVAPFLNCKDVSSALPIDFVNGFSIAVGKIEKGTNSKIHIHPVVTQATYVLSGRIDVTMKGRKDPTPYPLTIGKNSAVVTAPYEFFQLRNPYDEDCDVLYIVSPDYLFVMENEKVIYDDAVVLDYTWDELARVHWNPPALNRDFLQERQAAFKHLSKKKSVHQPL
jgi:mannose-6-phosphate isomerase-like protein (cupin superfamily)